MTWFPGQCYQWVSATYQDGGCEHFGVRTVANTGPVTSRWLCEDPQSPGVLTPVDPPTAVPGPTYFVQPPVAANNPPVLVVEVVAPEPAEAVNLFGDAQWIRVFKQEMQRAAALVFCFPPSPSALCGSQLASPKIRFSTNARIAVLYTNDSVACSSTLRRIWGLETATSETWKHMPTVNAM